MRAILIRALEVGTVLGLASIGFAISLGQVDTFSNSSFFDWTGGTDKTIPLGGPGGATDPYLMVVSTGDFGPGGNMAFNNSVQWAGNYTAADVNAIECDMRNLGTTVLQMRMILFTALNDKLGSAAPVVLQPGGAWQHVVFDVSPSGLTVFSGSATAAQARAACAKLMIRHNLTPQSGGEQIAATLGIDNITASAGRRVSGSISLGDAGSLAYPVQATIEYRTPGTQTVVAQRNVTLAENGAFNAPAPPVPGVYDMAIKYSHWLRRVAPINTTTGNATGVNLTLKNADIDFDNAVTILDYSVLSDYFDKFSSDSDWNTLGGNGSRPVDADLDSDGSVSILDYSILSDNFDSMGDD